MLTSVVSQKSQNTTKLLLYTRQHRRGYMRIKRHNIAIVLAYCYHVSRIILKNLFFISFLSCKQPSGLNSRNTKWRPVKVNHNKIYMSIYLECKPNAHSRAKNVFMICSPVPIAEMKYSVKNAGQMLSACTCVHSCVNASMYAHVCTHMCVCERPVVQTPTAGFLSSLLTAQQPDP